MSSRSHDPVAAGRRRLLLIVAVFVAPLVLASAWYALAPQTAPRADMHGTLIEPAQPIAPFDVPKSDGGRYALDDLRGHWTLIHPVGDACGEPCSKRLYDARQIHDALAQDRIRVRRLAVARQGEETSGLAEVLPEHSRLTVLRQGPEGDLMGQLPPTAPGELLLVDPLGNLMMRFPADAPASGILDDLEHLLESSQVG